MGLFGRELFAELTLKLVFVMVCGMATWVGFLHVH